MHCNCALVCAMSVHCIIHCNCTAIAMLIQLLSLPCPSTLAGVFWAFLRVLQCLSLSLCLSLCLSILGRIGELVPRDCLRNLTLVHRVGNCPRGWLWKLSNRD